MSPRVFGAKKLKTLRVGKSAPAMKPGFLFKPMNNFLFEGFTMVYSGNMAEMVSIPKKDYLALKKRSKQLSVLENELDLVGRRIELQEKEMKRKGLSYLSEEEALEKYR